MDIIKIIQLLLCFCFIVVIHEFGHYFTAKIFKANVEKFYVFYDYKFSLLKKKIGNTIYGIGWIPLGGYVKITGMLDDENLKESEYYSTFAAKKPWQKLIIILSGVAMNMILSFIIYIFLAWIYGDKFIDNKSLSNGIWVVSNSLKQIGLKNGDKIISIDNREIVNFNNIKTNILLGNKIKIQRNSQYKYLLIKPELIKKIISNKEELVLPRIPFVVGNDINFNKNIKPGDNIIGINGNNFKYFDEYVEFFSNNRNKKINIDLIRNGVIKNVNVYVDNNGKIGVPLDLKKSNNLALKKGYYIIDIKNYNFFNSIHVGIRKGLYNITNYLKQFKVLFNPSTGAYKQIGGIKSMYDLFPNDINYHYFWELTALISIMVGIFNLLPIPTIDGGYVPFILYEMISGKKIKKKTLEFFYTIGFIVFMIILLYANLNDFIKFLF